MWQVQVATLENGMKLYCHPTTANVNVSGIGFGAGSIYDPPGKTGLAHYVEHVITGRSKRYPDPREVDLLFWRYIGDQDSRNIRTDRSSVFYGHGDLLRRNYMLSVFDIMASFAHPKTRVIDPDRLEIERAAVHQEYHLRGMDVMETFLDDLMHQTMYEVNPARNRIDCEVKDLRSMTMKDVEGFLRRYYVPKNAFAIILGPKFEVAKALAQRYFGDWEERRTPTLDYDHADDMPKIVSVRSREVIAHPHIGQHHFALGFPTETHKTSDAATLDVIRNILEVRLNWLLREGNLDMDQGVYRSPVYTERSLVHGMIDATFATTSGEFEKRAEDIVLSEFRRLATDLVPHNELDAARDAIHNEYLDAFWNTPSNLCEMIIESATNGDTELEGLHAYRGDILRVTRRRIREVANKYFTGNYARVLIRPSERG